MTIRGKKKNNHGGSSLIIMVGLLSIIAIVLFLLFRDSSESSESDATVPTFLQDTPEATDSSDCTDIEYVRMPANLKSEIINYPGFTVSFNSDFKQPNYVVWELTRAETKSRKVKRSENFAPDPNVKGCPTLFDYMNSGYDRGHMAPAGDMKWSYEAMNSCFLLTNMSPQDHELNTGAWNKLEEKCRDWSVRDSAIVIVCGPILTDEITRYIGKNRVAVPERYFKVIYAPYAKPPRGIGFIMPNGYVHGGLQSCAVSIDEVEAITGYDFFSALPDNIESKIESQNNYPKWTRR